MLPANAVDDVLLNSSDNDESSSISFSSLIPALSFALDLTEDRPMGHVLRSCIIGMHIGEKIHLPQAQLANLFRALLLKDVGCSSGTSRLSEMATHGRVSTSSDFLQRKPKTIEKERSGTALEVESPSSIAPEQTIRTSGIRKLCKFDLDAIARYRCERAARISHDLGLPMEVTEALFEVDERWDGSGYPNNLQAEQISLLARIINIAQTLDLAAERYGRSTAIEIVSRRCGTWFDKGLVAASNLLHDRCELWDNLQFSDLLTRVKELEPIQTYPSGDVFAVDNICLAFAEVVDAKSPFTFTHSTNVAKIAVSMSEIMCQDQKSIKLIRRAALIHDIGKLGVPSSILEKPGRLSSSEWIQIHQHPCNTKTIVDKIPGFDEIANIAVLHHEKLDGTGYPYGLGASELPLLARILTTADIYDALSSSRPYRQKLSHDRVMKLMQNDAPHALDKTCLEALAITSRLS